MGIPMKPAIVVFAVLMSVLTPSTAVTQTTAPATRYHTLPIDVDARPDAPSPVRGDDGRMYLSYNILVTNWSEHDLTFSSIEVLRAGDTIPIVRYDTSALARPFRQRIALDSALATAAERLRLPAGRTSFVAIGAVFDSGSAIPSAVVHRIRFEKHPSITIITDQGTLERALGIDSEPLLLDQRPAAVIGPPVRGGPWICANGLAATSAHASAYVAGDARLRVPQRYGCDFQLVDSAASILPNPFPDTISNEMFYGHAEDILAVADATVAAVIDGIPENVPQANGEVRMAVALTNRTFSGNLVTLDLGGGRFAFYAHLRPGTIRVRLGQRVRRGDVIGELGNSGNSVGPHLHFQVGNGPSLNSSIAMPYVFDSWTFAGRWTVDAKTRTVHEALPLDGAIMIFPGMNRSR
jgi:hypothetical protein